MKEYFPYLIPILTAILGLIAGIILEKFKSKNALRSEKQKHNYLTRKQELVSIQEELYKFNKTFEFCLASLQINQGKWSQQIFLEWNNSLKNLESKLNNISIHFNIPNGKIDSYIPIMKGKLKEFENEVLNKLAELPPELYATQIDSIHNIVPLLKDNFNDCLNDVKRESEKLINSLKEEDYII